MTTPNAIYILSKKSWCDKSGYLFSHNVGDIVYRYDEVSTIVECGIENRDYEVMSDELANIYKWHVMHGQSLHALIDDLRELASELDEQCLSISNDAALSVLIDAFEVVSRQRLDTHITRMRAGIDARTQSTK